jgi:hypothetical protein
MQLTGAMMIPLRGAVWLGVCLLGLGCALGRPTLRVAYVSQVLRPNQVAGKKTTWDQAPELWLTLRRGTGRFAGERRVMLRAVYDGSVLAIQATWNDPTTSTDRLSWIWDPTEARYLLRENPVDQLAIHWPLGATVETCMLEGLGGRYDVWQWLGGWSDISGVAEDRLLVTRPHPAGIRPSQVAGTLYPALRGEGWVEVIWRHDAGVGGTVASARPRWRLRLRMPGAEARSSIGSAGDVLTGSSYRPLSQKGPARRRGEWYRPLAPQNPHEDVALDGPGPLRFAIALFDNTGDQEHYTSGSIALVLEKTRWRGP